MLVFIFIISETIFREKGSHTLLLVFGVNKYIIPNIIIVMKKKYDEIIDLGHGCIYENGEIKEIISENKKDWMTWDEGWDWVIQSLQKIHGNRK